MSDAVWFIDPHADNLQQVVVRARALAAELFEGQRIRWTVEATDDASRVLLESEQRRHVYLILKEALTNVLRHAHATNVAVVVNASQGRLRVKVTDDGIGLDGKTSDNYSGAGGGRGLENIRRRASTLGGTTRIESPSRGRGTSIVVDVPVTHSHVHALATSDLGANMSPVNGARGEASSPETVRVAIVEDDKTTREGLAALIEGTPGYRCAGRYSWSRTCCASHLTGRRTSSCSTSICPASPGPRALGSFARGGPRRKC